MSNFNKLTKNSTGFLIKENKSNTQIFQADSLSIETTIVEQLVQSKICQIFNINDENTEELFFYLPLNTKATLINFIAYIGDDQTASLEILNDQDAKKKAQITSKINKNYLNSKFENNRQNYYVSSLMNIPANTVIKVEYLIVEQILENFSEYELIFPIGTPTHDHENMEIDIKLKFITPINERSIKSNVHLVLNHDSNTRCEVSISPTEIVDDVIYIRFQSIRMQQMETRTLNEIKAYIHDEYAMICLRNHDLTSHDTKRKILILLDISNNMQEIEVFDEIRNALINFLKKLKPNDEINIITPDFNNTSITGGFVTSKSFFENSINRLKTLVLVKNHVDINQNLNHIKDINIVNVVFVITATKVNEIFFNQFQSLKTKVMILEINKNTHINQLHPFSRFHQLMNYAKSKSVKALVDICLSNDHIENIINRFYDWLYDPIMENICLDINQDLNVEGLLNQQDLQKLKNVTFLIKKSNHQKFEIKDIQDHVKLKGVSNGKNIEFNVDNVISLSNINVSNLLKTHWAIDQILTHTFLNHVDEVIRLSILYQILSQYTHLFLKYEILQHDILTDMSIMQPIFYQYKQINIGTQQKGGCFF